MPSTMLNILCTSHLIFSVLLSSSQHVYLHFRVKNNQGLDRSDSLLKVLPSNFEPRPIWFLISLPWRALNHLLESVPVIPILELMSWCTFFSHDIRLNYWDTPSLEPLGSTLFLVWGWITRIYHLLELWLLFIPLINYIKTSILI